MFVAISKTSRYSSFAVHTFFIFNFFKICYNNFPIRLVSWYMKFLNTLFNFGFVLAAVVFWNFATVQNDWPAFCEKIIQETTEIFSKTEIETVVITGYAFKKAIQYMPVKLRRTLKRQLKLFNSLKKFF